MSDTSAKSLVECPVCLYLVPLTPSEQTTTVTVLIVVFTLQLNLQQSQKYNKNTLPIGAGNVIADARGIFTKQTIYYIHTCLSLMFGKGIPT